MLATIRYTKGLGSSAIYARVRDASGNYLVFATGAWQATEDGTTKTFLPEIADSSTESRYQLEIDLSAITVEGVVEYILASSGDVLGEDAVYSGGISAPVSTTTGPLAGDLCVLADVKDDLGIDASDITADTKLQRLITNLSAQFEAECDRVFRSLTYSGDTFEGTKDRRQWRPDLGYSLRLAPKQYPVTSVISLTVDSRPIPQRTDPNADGWTIRDGLYIDIVGLTVLPITYGYYWDFRRSLVSGSYIAGYATIPVDISQAVAEWVAWKYLRNPRRTGIVSSTVAGGGETTTFSQFDKPLSTAQVIAKYRRRVAP